MATNNDEKEEYTDFIEPSQDWNDFRKKTCSINVTKSLF